MKLAKEIIVFAKSLIVPCLPARQFLLQSGHALLSLKLAQLKEAKGKHMESAAEDVEWRKKTQHFCDQSKQSYASLSTPNEIRKSEWYQNLTVREQHGIAVHSKKERGMDMTSLDSSQCITRMAVGRGDKLPTITPG